MNIKDEDIDIYDHFNRMVFNKTHKIDDINIIFILLPVAKIENIFEPIEMILVDTYQGLEFR